MSPYQARSLFPASRQVILSLLFGHPDEAFYLRQIAQVTQLAVGNVQRELAKLTKDGVLMRRKTRRHVYFKANPDCPIYEELKGIADKTVRVAYASEEPTPFVDRSVLIKTTLAQSDDSGFMHGSAADRLSTVWDLTQSVWAFVKNGDAEQRLQRNVSVLTRP